MKGLTAGLAEIGPGPERENTGTEVEIETGKEKRIDTTQRATVTETGPVPETEKGNTEKEVERTDTTRNVTARGIEIGNARGKGSANNREGSPKENAKEKETERGNETNLLTAGARGIRWTFIHRLQLLTS